MTQDPSVPFRPVRVVGCKSRGSHPTLTTKVGWLPGNFIRPLAKGFPLADSPEVHDAGSFTYYIGGYETTDGQHYNVEAGDPEISEDELYHVDYLSVYIIEQDRWIHVNGPFEDFIDVDYDIYDVLDEY